MKTKETDLTREFLRECFDYHEDGYLVWKVRPFHHFTSLTNMCRFNTARAGSRAGYFNKRTDSKQEGFGYYRIGLTFNGKDVGHFKMHRLIWCWHYGNFPKLIDHYDNDTRNNKISNLREGTVKKNSYNLKRPTNNTTGFKGVSYSNDPKRVRIPYRASIEYNGYSFLLGSYPTAEEAACAYNIAAKLLFKEFANLNNINLKEEDFVPKGKFLTETYFEIKNGIFDWTSRTKRTPKGKKDKVNEL